MKWKYITWIPAFLLMATIFWFSSKNAQESTNSSMGITKQIVRLVEQIQNNPWKDEERAEKLEQLDHVVRKCAHGLEYCMLCILFLFHFQVSIGKRKKVILYSYLATVSYAITDEIHQLFVPGRSCQIRDVCIDSIGAFIGILIFFGVFVKIYKKMYHTKLEKK